MISQNNPLHISLFPAEGDGQDTKRDDLEYNFMLNSCLDIFEARMPTKTVGHDFGLLHALDERIAMYGWLTNTSVKIVIVIDMEGRPAATAEAGKAAMLGLRSSDLTPVSAIISGQPAACTDHPLQAFHAIQTAYIKLLRNPFYAPDDHDPKLRKGRADSLQIISPRFIKEIERIGKTWQPGALL